MAISEERLGQIALALVKRRLKKEGVRLSPSGVREIGSLASEIGMETQELKLVLIELLPELITEAFGFDSATLVIQYTTEKLIPLEPHELNTSHSGPKPTHRGVDESHTLTATYQKPKETTT